MQTATRLQNVSILHTFDVKKNTKRLQKNIKLIWLGRAPGARPLEQGKSGRTNVFVFYFTQNVRSRLAWRHQPPSFIIMASQGALAPRLARSIRALGHPYSRMWGTNTSPKRGDRILAPHKRGMGSISIVMRGMCKFDRKIMVASFLPSWLESAPMARLGSPLCAQYRPTSAHIRIWRPRTCVPRLCGGTN